MGSAEKRPIHIGYIQLFPNHGQTQEEALGLHLTQNLLAENPGDRLHLSRNGSVISRQIVMASAGVNNHQRIALLGEVVVHGLHLRIIVLEVDVCQSASATGHLIQQAAGLSEVHILRKLGNLGPMLVSQRTLIVQLIKNRAQHDLEGGGAAQTTAAANRRSDRCIKAADFVAFLLQLVGHASNQRCGGVLFVLTGCKVVQRNGNRRITLAVDVHHAVLTGRNGGNGIQIDGGCQHLAAVVVGMVAGNLRASGSTDHVHRAGGVEQILMALKQGRITGGLGHHHAFTLAVESVESLHDLGGFQLPNHLCVLAHIHSHPLLVIPCLWDGYSCVLKATRCQKSIISCIPFSRIV